LLNPKGIAVCGDDVYVADATGGGRILKYNRAGVCQSVLTVPVSNPMGMAIDPTGTYLFIVDKGNNRLLRYTLSNGTVMVVTTSLDQPESVTVDSAGALWVTSRGSGEVKHYVDYMGSYMNSSALGTGSLGGTPVGVAAIGTDLYVAVQNAGTYSLVRRNPADGSISTTSASIDNPGLMASDGSGYLYMPETTAGDTKLFARTSTGDLELVNTCSTQGEPASPVGIAVDAEGKVYVTGSNGIKVYGTCVVPAAPPCALPATSGTGSILASVLSIKHHYATPTPTPSQTATPTVSPTVVPSLLAEVVAAPNVSRSGQPVRIRYQLGEQARVRLSIHNLTGEELWSTQAEGTAGSNELVWQVRNRAQEEVAAGLYLYVLRVETGTASETAKGKIVLFR